MSHLLLAEDTALEADLNEKLQMLVSLENV